MKDLARVMARLILAVKQSYKRKWTFLGIFAVAFLSIASVLGSMGLLPDGQIVATASDTSLVAAVVAAPPSVVVPELPQRIVIPSIKLTAIIENPMTTDIETLDHLLLAGAVRYPTSAKLGETGNVVLFGHSSYL